MGENLDYKCEGSGIEKGWGDESIRRKIRRNRELGDGIRHRKG